MSGLHWNMRTGSAVLAAACMLASAAMPAAGEEAPNLAEALTGGKVALQFRYRYEDVDQDNALRDASAHTLRSRLNYTSLAWHGWQAFAEVDNLSALGDEDYNSTANGNADYSLVADPEGTEVNQAWLSFSGLDATVLKFGRQRILLDNERFVGGVGWRQNEQTFDGASIVNKSLPDTTATYAWVYNVNRVFGPDDGTSTAWKGDWDANIHLLNVAWAGLSFGTLSVYDYLLDIEDRDARAQSNNTLGLRFAGTHGLSGTVALNYALEYARQEDYGDNPVSYDADYWLLDLGVSLPGAVKLKLAQEVLEGDADSPGKAFRTPLATGHAFQGWADLFLATPNAGLQDRYAGASVAFAGFTAAATWHDFEAEDGGASYGDELDLSLARKFGAHVAGLLKYADYNEDGFGVDTRKIWLQVQLDF